MAGIPPEPRLIKEAQGVIAYAIYDAINGKQSRKRVHLYADADIRFHGDRTDPDYISAIEKFCQAKGEFNNLFTKGTGIVASRDSTDDGWVVPSFLTRRDAPVTLRDTLPRECLERAVQTSSQLITGRAIYEKAELVAQNLRKAKEYADLYLKKGNGKLHSGHEIEDYLAFVLVNMKKDFDKAAKAKKKRGQPVAVDAGTHLEEEEDIDDSGDSGIPSFDPALAQVKPPAKGPNKLADSKWMFFGFWAFYLYGPLPFGDNRSTVLAQGDLDAPKGTVSRAAMKNQDRDEAKAKASKPRASPTKKLVEAQMQVVMESKAARAESMQKTLAALDSQYIKQQIKALKMQFDYHKLTKDFAKMEPIMNELKVLKDQMNQARALLSQKSSEIISQAASSVPDSAQFASESSASVPNKVGGSLLWSGSSNQSPFGSESLALGNDRAAKRPRLGDGDETVRSPLFPTPLRRSPRTKANIGPVTQTEQV
jgi:hypothetical protein